MQSSSHAIANIEASNAPGSEPKAPGEPAPIFDLLLRGQDRLTERMLDERALGTMTQKMVSISLLGLAVHGVVVGIAAQALGPGGSTSIITSGHPILWMPLAFVLAFVGAIGVCLPSFYFYTQLSGLDASFRLVTAQALRTQATASVLLLGALPFYAAVVLGCAVGAFSGAETVVLIGLALPFVIGLYGMYVLFTSFRALAQVLPITHARRGNFLGRMVLCWCAIYSVVAPVALFRLCVALGRIV